MQELISLPAEPISPFALDVDTTGNSGEFYPPIVMKTSISESDGIPNPEAYKDWHVPLCQDRISLREAHANLAALGAKQNDIPLRVQLVENPHFRLPGVEIFHGAVDLTAHDYIHILLGRGMLPEDEAFVIGFTMGTSKKVTTVEENLYALASKYFYPAGFRFGQAELNIFRSATKLGYVSGCHALDKLDYEEYLDCKLCDIRQRIGLEIDLLQAYYRIEQKRFPQFKGSQRLLVT